MLPDRNDAEHNNDAEHSKEGEHNDGAEHSSQSDAEPTSAELYETEAFAPSVHESNKGSEPDKTHGVDASLSTEETSVPDIADVELGQQGGVAPMPLPFSHLAYAGASTAFVFGLYMVSSVFLSFFWGNASFDTWLQGAGQLLFMLVPALVVAKQSALGRRTILRMEGDISIQQWALGLGGLFPLLLLSTGWMIVQEALLPDHWISTYKYLQDSSDTLYRRLLVSSTSLGLLSAYIVGAIIPAIAEESLFRGLLQRSLEEVWSPYVAIFVAAIVFSLVHLNPVAFVPLMLLGAYFGLLAWYTRSLALPIVAHCFNNLWSITWMNLVDSDVPADIGGTAWWQGILTMLVGIGGVAFILIRLFSTRRLLRSSELPPHLSALQD